MAVEASVAFQSSAPKLSGNRDTLTMEERERSLNEAIQWLRVELNSLKSQDQSLMRQFSVLRTQINTLKDELPGSLYRSSTASAMYSPMTPKPSNDDDVFFSDSQARINSDTSFRNKSYSSGSDEDKF